MIRAATAADLEAIAAIQEAAPEASQWKPEEYLNYDCRVAGDPVQAFLVTRATAPDEYEILNLAVTPAARRTGLARALLQTAFHSAPGAWFLEVRASNHAAIKLYESLDFRASGVRLNYYADSSESAIVMVRQK